MESQYKGLELFLEKHGLLSPQIRSTIAADDRRSLFGLAAVALEGYVERHPQDAEGRAHLGNAYFELGLIDKAISQYEFALKINPGDYSVRHDLGEALREKGYREGGC